MIGLALGGRFRRILTKIHRWTGLALLVFLLVVGITGAMLSFRGELDRIVNSKLYQVEPMAQFIPYSQLIKSVESHFTDAVVSSVVLPRKSTDSVIVYLKSRMAAHVTHVHVTGMKMDLEFNQVFVNPYTAEILGQRNTSRFMADRESIFPVLARLHSCLFLDETGGWILGVCALVWLLSSFVGLALAWPKEALKWAGWRSLLTIRSRDGVYKFNYDLHRAAGLISLPVLIVVAFTSFYLNLPAVAKPLISVFSPLSAKSIPVARSMDINEPIVSPEEAIRAAGKAMPSAIVNSFSRDFAKGLYNVRMQLPNDVSPTGNNNAYIRMDDGSLFRLVTFAEKNSGDTFAAWQFPLHTGRAFGVFGQILILAAALVLVTLCIAGFNVWLRKQRAEHRRFLKQKEMASGDMQKVSPT